MRPIIDVENLGKRYRLTRSGPAYATLREELVAAIQAPFRRMRGGSSAGGDETLWALRHINLKVYPGQRLGVIGRNGAGKSTLLKIISQITEPTEGSAKLYGRVGSLLEVGTGFHGELTGRENIYLNGAILGMKRAQIARSFDEIVAFAEVERFLDTPVKHYSTGMYMRLAFAVAAHLQPEILIVDEVLAVGDAAFRTKCMGKMSEVARGGRTVIFVSHNMAAVQSLCSHVVWLDAGHEVREGPPAIVVRDYLRSVVTTMHEHLWDDPATAPGNEKLRMRRASVRTATGSPEDEIATNTPLRVEFEYWNFVPGSRLNFNVVLCAEDGTAILNTGSSREPLWHGRGFPAGLFHSSFDIPGNLLNDGTHRVHLYIVRERREVVYQMEDILIFEVLDMVEERKPLFGKWIGAVRPQLEWQTGLIEEAPHPPQ
jgi:ABC-type polysaccharide/polyol phosphate transport system, ATPase component